MLTEANKYGFSISANESIGSKLAIASASVVIVTCLNYNSIFQNKDRFGFKICLKFFDNFNIFICIIKSIMCEYCGCTPKDVKKPLKELPLLGSEIKIVKRPKEVSLFYQNRRMG